MIDSDFCTFIYNTFLVTDRSFSWQHRQAAKTKFNLPGIVYMNFLSGRDPILIVLAVSFCTVCHCIALLYNHIYFFVRAEVFQLGIVASPSCTEYHWGSLIAFY